MGFCQAADADTIGAVAVGGAVAAQTYDKVSRCPLVPPADEVVQYGTVAFADAVAVLGTGLIAIGAAYGLPTLG